MRYCGEVGYGSTVDVRPGVKAEHITERTYFGDVLRPSRSADVSDTVNPNLTVGNTISIVADGYAFEHIFDMRYIKWAGALWLIRKVDIEPPRLVLLLGEVYNGPVAT